jgi:diguanylate cyclase (GGDEF)-like protein/putative nucleotidyltransferase with HDIG domain
VSDPDRRLASAVARIGELPVLDHTVQRVLALCRDVDSSTSQLTGVLENDPEFAANLLRYANSAYASRPVRVRTMRQAVTMVGRVAIGQLAVEAATYRFLERAPGNGRASVGSMHIHACAVGACALELAKVAGAVTEVAHLAGLLHDIGKLVMPIAFGEQPLDEIARYAPAGPMRVTLERERLGCDHAAAGAMLASAARVDEAVIAAILAHHDPYVEPTAEIACVQLANAIVGMTMGIDPDPVLITHALGHLRLDARTLDQVAARTMPARTGPDTSTLGAVEERIAELEEQAGSDELTGLANRRRWKRLASERIRNDGGAVMICDIDHFKRVNDCCGHTTGDLVLSEIARILSHHGFAGRLGGDELVLHASVAPDQAAAVAKHILDEVRTAFPPGSIEGWNAGLSIGIAIVPARQPDLTGLLSAADDALYEAKRAGRGRAVLARLTVD